MENRRAISSSQFWNDGIIRDGNLPGTPTATRGCTGRFPDLRCDDCSRGSATSGLLFDRFSSAIPAFVFSRPNRSLCFGPPDGHRRDSLAHIETHCGRSIECTLSNSRRRPILRRETAQLNIVPTYQPTIEYENARQHSAIEGRHTDQFVIGCGQHLAHTRI